MPHSPLKNRIKKSLLTVYNPLVHGLRHMAGWCRVFATGRWSPCEICGRKGPKRLLQAAVSVELVAMWGLSADDARRLRQKESMICPWCGSKLRGRRLAGVYLRTVSPACPDLASYRTNASGGTGFKNVLILNRVDGLSDYLGPMPGVIQSEFVEGARPGEVVAGQRHEDAEALSFADGAFDMVISSETLEHIPRLDKALAEIGRVLRPGGVHIFTIPLKPGTARTEPRMKLDEDGCMVDCMQPRLHHPGGSWGWPVVTEFGDDLPQYLAGRGWLVQVDTGEADLPGRCLSQGICPVLVMQKLV
ncbi:MAG: class I SAM-dependent methyltransferase [Isosphaeraceae bacterium]